MPATLFEATSRLAPTTPLSAAERRARAEHDGRLASLRRVVSPEPVLTPEIVKLARAVADSHAGTLADVLARPAEPAARVEGLIPWEASVLIVAQRVSTILDADKIVVLDNGRIVGVGTHRELLASCTTYREIAQSQLTAEELA